MTLQPAHSTAMHLFGHNLNKTYKCLVRYLDDTSWETTYSRHEDSQKLFDRICNHVNLIEKDYFGLRFVDEKKQRKWLDLSKNARNQLKKCGKEENVSVSFRVKFYPPDPMTRLNEELTRYQLFMQLRRDLQHRRLYGTSGEEALLLADILQSEIGDMPPGTNMIPDNYRALMQHGQKGEGKALDQWLKQQGIPKQQAEGNFLSHASHMDTFGIDPHPVRDESTGESIFLGYNHFGVIAFQGSKKVVHLNWAHILKLTYEKKTFLIYFLRDSKKVTKGFKCGNPKAAKHLWRNAIETKIFFTAPNSQNVPAVKNEGSLFSRASRLRFSGRVAREAFDNGLAQQRDNVVFQRSAFGLRPGDAEVYEGVLATPGLHRRPSIYPVGKERDLSAARSMVESQTSQSAAPPLTPPPDDAGPPRPDSATSGSAESETVSPPSPRRYPVAPTVPSVQSEPRVEEVFEYTKSRIEEVLNGSLLSNGAVVQEISPVRRPVASSSLGKMAMGGLMAGMALVSVYTLFETNWLPAGLVALLAPLRTSLYAPVKLLLSQMFFAGQNDTAVVDGTHDIVMPIGPDV